MGYPKLSIEIIHYPASLWVSTDLKHLTFLVSIWPAIYAVEASQATIVHGLFLHSSQSTNKIATFSISAISLLPLNFWVNQLHSKPVTVHQLSKKLIQGKVKVVAHAMTRKKHSWSILRDPKDLSVLTVKTHLFEQQLFSHARTQVSKTANSLKGLFGIGTSDISDYTILSTYVKWCHIYGFQALQSFPLSADSSVYKLWGILLSQLAEFVETLLHGRRQIYIIIVSW